jgi:hypothetical protein
VDAFWTEEQTTFRRKARAYFRRDLGISQDADGFPAFSGSADVSERVLIIEEAAFFRPRLGLELMKRWMSGEAGSSPEGRLIRLARIVGTVAHVFEAGAGEARDRGYFESSLMGCREFQEVLAGLASGIEILRLGACRICHLLARGERDRGEAELALLYAKALSLDREARSVALGLLGGAWTKAKLPGDGFSPEYERNRS